MMDGFVLVHGKLSGPCVAEKSPLGQTASQLLQLGCIVDYVDYPWSKSRRFDSTVEQSIIEIDAAICRVRSAGASRIHIIGHSMGSTMLMYYATLNDNFDTLTLLCPAHNTHLEKFQRTTSWCIEQAQIKAAQGIDTPQPYIDFYMSQPVVEYISPTAYVSYFDALGNSNMVVNAAKMLPQSTLFVIGQLDVNTPSFKELVYDKVAHVNASYLLMDNETHHSLATAAVPKILSWIANLYPESGLNMVL
jgi:pimeloyl-ACP methyl ester carboxylesterase